jgi:glyoxylase-like metal-dependent hydrolase (beta-lactamase superfamily II)
MADLVDFTIINIGTLSRNTYWGESQRLRQPTATCTLLKSKDMNLLVDPSPYAPELEKMLFANAGLKPEQINAVFATHFHGDHLFGLDLFPDAQWLMAQAGLDEWREASHGKQKQLHSFQCAEGNLPDAFTLLHSPGHTHGLHTLSVQTKWGFLVVAGDAVMTKDYFADEKGYDNSVDFRAAAETIRMIKTKAALVIPGHGNLILNC